MAHDRKETLLGVVHCSATPPGRDIGVVEINRWHYKRGIWSPRGRTGYHGVIRRNGTLELGREALEMGAHALGHNDVSVAACLVGGVEEDAVTPEDNFTVEQWDTLDTVVSYWLVLWPEIILAGHRDLGAPKACPSFELHDWLRVHRGDEFAETNRERLEKYLQAYQERKRGA